MKKILTLLLVCFTVACGMQASKTVNNANQEKFGGATNSDAGTQ